MKKTQAALYSVLSPEPMLDYGKNANLRSKNLARQMMQAFHSPWQNGSGSANGNA
jgi:hypothetical protein